MSRFSKATRRKAKARVALVGPSGSGKTYTALVLARGLAGPAGRIALIDTERASAAKYAGDVAELDTLDLDHHAPKEYVDAIKDAARAGYDVLVIDSLSHAWSGRGGALEQVDQAAKRNQGNSYVAWRDVTPQHNALVDAILTYPGHVIVTMRTKTEYVLEDGKNGKKTPRKVGLAPIQRDGMEYEFDIVADVDLDHTMVVSKSRCSALAGAVIDRPDAKVADVLRAWLDQGEEAKDAPKPADGLAGAISAPASSPWDDARAALDLVEDETSMVAWLHRHVDAVAQNRARAWGAMVARARVLGMDESALRGLVEQSKNEHAA